MKKNVKKHILIAGGSLLGTYAGMSILGRRAKEKEARGIDDDNQYLSPAAGAAPKPTPDSGHELSLYTKRLKPMLDKALSFGGLLVLSPLYAAISAAIVIDDPGPVLFKQKRVGKDKRFFVLHKFRSMKMSTPHDVPTHMLENPEQYITRVGRFLRKSSLDELPQIWDIFIGNMSVIGPRPALWNQCDLVAQRDKYGANSISPGLTGWAQINGRDELEIPDKAKLDGAYVQEQEKGSLNALMFDIKCFLRTLSSVSRKEGVVEGGTGELKKGQSASKYRFEYKGVDRMQLMPEDRYQISDAGGASQLEGCGLKGKIAVLSSHTPSLFWFRLDMMRYFISLGYEVLAVGNEGEAAWRQKFADNGVRYIQAEISRNGTNPLKDLKTLKSLYGVLKKERPDKIFTFQAKTIIYGSMAAKALGISQVYPLIAGMGSVFLNNDAKSRLIQRVLGSEYKIALKSCPAVFFQNRDDISFFTDRRLVRPSQVHMLHGSGVSLEKFTVQGLPAEPAFLCISRLIRDKGVYEYLLACREIRKTHPKLRCLLVGPYDSNPTALSPDQLRPFIDDGSIEYFGEQEDVRPFLAQCWVFVLPSYREGTPKTVLEAMAAGRAVITTDAPGCRETVIDGKNGFLVPIKSVDAIVEKMEYLLNRPETIERMGKNGRLMAEELFDVKKVNADIASAMSL